MRKCVLLRLPDQATIYLGSGSLSNIAIAPQVHLAGSIGDIMFKKFDPYADPQINLARLRLYQLCAEVEQRRLVKQYRAGRPKRRLLLRSANRLRRLVALLVAWAHSPLGPFPPRPPAEPC